MPVPKNIEQAKVVVNGQRATDLGRAPKVVKVWREKPQTSSDEAKEER